MVCVVALTNIGRFGRTNRTIEQTRAAQRLDKETLRELFSSGLDKRRSDCGWLGAAATVVGELVRWHAMCACIAVSLAIRDMSSSIALGDM